MKKQTRTAKKQLDTLKLTITDLDLEGMGLAPHNGKTALVPGGLPGETVVAAVEHVGRTHIYTQLQRVLRKSPSRTATRLCPNDQKCLGCPLISMTYQGQLSYKQQRVADALNAQQIAQADSVLPVLAAEKAIGYRASAKLVFGRKKGKVQIGLYKRGSHDIVDCGDCPVHHPLINRIAAVVRDEVERQGISTYSPTHKNGLLHYLLVRVSPINNKAMVTFVSKTRNLQQLPHLAKWLTRKVPEVVSVHQNVNPSTGNVILGQETLKLLGTPDLIERIGDIRLHIAPTAFFQVNTEQAARIYSLVRQWAQLKPDETAVDLYCGIGGIALHLAQDARSVYGIEVVESAVRSARKNAELNGLKNCRFNAGDAAEGLHKLAQQLKKVDVATINPPRKGCDPELLEALIELQPARLIYVSCDPDSLSRDLKILTQSNYAIEHVQPVDMFPQTAHIETVVLLTRQ